jgi:ATP-dependent Clp protease adaptor protein ClpS|tara:strand:+ start:1359 stop:1688 length:330 start_codon:yes stop_codon:yes gene_type:complete
MENLKVMSTKTDAVIDEKIEIDVAIPKMWHVVVMNDEFTPMELVVDILKSVFKLEEDIANKKTLEIHNHGAAVVGNYVFEIAEQKALEATKMARMNGSPLKLTIEEQNR